MAGEPGDAAAPPVDARVARTRHDILRAALRVLTTQGLDALSHPHLAQVSGYSRATVYNHWPTRERLLRDAFGYLGQAARHEHYEPAGDLRADLIGELSRFRFEMEQHDLHHSIAALAAAATTAPELALIRDGVVADGERVLRQILGDIVRGPDLDAAVMMLAGAVLDSALLHGRLPADELIAAVVDLLLPGLESGR